MPLCVICLYIDIKNVWISWMGGNEKKKKAPHSSQFANACPTFFIKETPLSFFLFAIPLILSLSLVLLSAVLLRSRARLALINVPGIRLALHLSFPLPSLLQLHPTFYTCSPCTRNTSRLQLQLVPVLSHFHTHIHTPCTSI